MKDLLTNLNKIEELKQELKDIENESIKNGFCKANTILSALNNYLNQYNFIMKKLNMNCTIFTEKRYYDMYYNLRYVNIRYDRNINLWTLDFDHTIINLKNGIQNHTDYNILCVHRHIIQELSIDEIINKLEELINKRQKEMIDELSKQIQKEKETLESFCNVTINNIKAIYLKLFKLKEEFKNTDNLNLIEPIIKTIDNLEDYIAEDLD